MQWIESRGLLAVKIAQMYAIRSDLLSSESCSKLDNLYEQATPAEWLHMEAVLRKCAPEAFWKDVTEINQEPLAVASMGQVHTARLRNGKEVVVKILRTDQAEAFLQDVQKARFLAQCALFFYPKLAKLADPLGTIETIERTTLTEINLLNEIDGTAELTKLRDEMPYDVLKHLSFPEIYPELSSERVLVVERLRQKSVRRALEDRSFDYAAILRLFQLQGCYLFLLGRFHGDLHPGNVCYDDGKFWFIDNANVENVDPYFTQGLLKFLGCLGKQDFTEAARVLASLSLIPQHDTSVFEKAFANLYAGFGGKPIGEESLTNQMMATVKLAVHSGMEFPAGAFPVIKSLMYLDGMALKCAPEAHLLEDVMEFANWER